MRLSHAQHTQSDRGDILAENHNVIVYKEKGRYAGWPANYGIWSWGDEIVVGFTLGYHDENAGFHKRDRERPFVTMEARSLDGGETWEVSKMNCKTPGDRGVSADEHMKSEMGVGQAVETGDMPVDCPGGINFAHPDFALMCARSGLIKGAISWFYYSYDRCKTWEGPFNLPMFGQTGIAARTDYIVSNKDECMFFLTSSKSNGEEGQVFCARTVDGGKSFNLVSWVCHEPKGFAIMPASVRLSEFDIIVAVRCCENGGNWIDLYSSDDNGSTWKYVNRPVKNTGTGGNPPTMTKLHDGRICMTYGYRDAPYSMKAKISEDNGKTWGDEIVLRNDGGDHDIGYPRTVQRTDGMVVTVYYFDDHADSERYIGATMWKP